MTAIEFENISKQYRLGLVSTKTLSHDLNRWWQTSILRKEDPYLKIGETNDRATKGESDYVWALRDINFKVEQGDVVGIIGKNGAGKSTLLKLLSRVTAPTTGTIRARGRIASLLEVGTGFHPEMTGRENIYLNGAIMGMTKQEIKAKLDEIVDFSGCERYLDTPVKRYSSGMTVRLGFAVAAHLDPEILVVDEVLAVGDAEFQKKAIGKMQDVSRGEGRTVLFVSHNMASIRSLCNNGVLLKDGMVEMIGKIDEVVDSYISTNFSENISHSIIDDRFRDALLPKDIEFTEVELINENVGAIATDEPLCLRFKLRRNNSVMKKMNIALHIKNQSDVCVGTVISPLYDIPQGVKDFGFDMKILGHNLVKGHYSISLSVGLKDIDSGIRDYDVIHNSLSFSVDCESHVNNKNYAIWLSCFGSHKFQDVEFNPIF